MSTAPPAAPVFVDQRTQDLLNRLPLPQTLSVASAAEVLGGSYWVAELMHAVATGDLTSWSHSPAEGGLREWSNKVVGTTTFLPRIDEASTAPSTILVDGREILWRWCIAFEAMAQGVDDPQQESVEAREREVRRLAAFACGAIVPVAGASELPRPASAETLRRRTLLTVIAALCQKAGIDRTGRGAASAIASATEELGAPVGDDAIRDILREIPDALERRLR